MIKIYDKSESELVKIESSKNFLEDVSYNKVVYITDEDGFGNRVKAEVYTDGSVSVTGLTQDGTATFLTNIYELLLKFPIISQYQD